MIKKRKDETFGEMIDKREEIYNSNYISNIEEQNKLTIEAAERLITAVQNNGDWERALVSFRSRFDHANVSILSNLPENLPDVMISLLKNYTNLSCTALINCMTAIYDWIKQNHSTIAKFFVPDVIEPCCNIVLLDGNGNEHILLLALLLIRFLCSSEQNEVLGFDQFILNSRRDVVQKLILYASESNSNISIRKEALCTIWTILRNKPNRMLIADFGVLVSHIMKRVQNECFEFLVAVAAAFIACGGGTDIVVHDIEEIKLMFTLFPRLPIIYRSRILYLIMNIFETGEEINEILIRMFDWSITECISQENDEDEVFNFLRMTAVAFALSESLVESAAKANVLTYLLQITRNEAIFINKRYAMLALLSAFQYGSYDVCLQLLRNDFLDDICSFISDTSSYAVVFRIFVCMPKFTALLERTPLEPEMTEDIMAIVNQELAGRVTEDMHPVEISESASSALFDILSGIDSSLFK